MTHFNGADSLALSKVIADEKLAEGESFDCPTCGQHAKVYKRTITSSMAYALIQMYRAKGDEHGWFHLPSVVGHGGDAAKLAYWNFIEPKGGERADGSKRTGWWRITFDGEAFVRGTLFVRRYVHVYNGAVLGKSGHTITIRDALGTRFNYDALMFTTPVPSGTMEPPMEGTA